MMKKFSLLVFILLMGLSSLACAAPSSNWVPLFSNGAATISMDVSTFKAWPFDVPGTSCTNHKMAAAMFMLDPKDADTMIMYYREYDLTCRAEHTACIAKVSRSGDIISEQDTSGSGYKSVGSDPASQKILGVMNAYYEAYMQAQKKQ